ncbi:hypothetical protein [Hamadaea tsunoensis]|uniref:hypothetical protein n=1 Tax=Hamadaea tsunoensis TaxID=53368 RepID=UPI0004826BBA|nr:hypothetical protein [Hamadaea tsunoensis]
MTRLQQAAYDAQLAAGLPISPLATAILALDARLITVEHCASYIDTIQQMPWFRAAFPAHSVLLHIIGGRGISHADARRSQIKVGATDRQSPARCEHACLHELAHIVSSDYADDGVLREPKLGRASSKGHHEAWRVNFVFIVRMVLGGQAAARLRREFNQWGLPTRK